MRQAEGSGVVQPGEEKDQGAPRELEKGME